MGRKRNGDFNTTALLNTTTYQTYLDRLTELSISMFEWKNVPPSIDVRYVELQLFLTGVCVYFHDDIIGADLCLNNINQGRFNVYGEPILRRAYSRYNNYQKMLKESNSVLIWNNYLRCNSYQNILALSRKLALLDRIIDVNVNAQKTPILLQGSEQQRLTLQNLYMQYDGNYPFIFGDKNLDINGLSAISTGAPYVADKLYTLKTQIWNEALTYLGISNINVQKKERLITDEVMRNQGGTIASRYSRLESRREAVKKINKMFNQNIEVNYREDYQEISTEMNPTGGEDYE